MPDRTHASNEADLPRGTLVELFMDAVDRLGDHPAFRYFPGSGPELVALSYREAYERVRAAATGLAGMGIQRGDRAAILSENRPEWALADYACLCGGVADVPIYATLPASQVAYILEDSGARLVFVSTEEQLEKVREARSQSGAELQIVIFDEGVDAPDAIPWSRLLEEGRDAGTEGEEALRASALSSGPDDLATILYTSGTTGHPKGVMLTHDNLHSNIAATNRVITVSQADSTLSFLPLSHVLQRMADYLFFSRGCTIAYAHDLTTVAEDLRIVQPTVVVSVPRVYEKVYNKVMDARGIKGRLVQWARGVALAWSDAEMAGREPGAGLRLKRALADRVVFRKIRGAVGGRLRFFVSGGAPLEPAIARFFHGAGLMILEGYGLTETSPVTNINTPERFKIGTVGPAVPGTEIRIAEDGEILVRGPQVMKGYYNLPEQTAEVVTPDGWFHTGDIGEIDADGFLRITDRKKDLIVTAGGKNVAPQPIENRLKTNAFVEQLVMVGDRRRFVALLVVPAFDALEAWARERALAFSDRRELLRLSEVQTMLEREVLGGLGDLAAYERPKKLALLEEEFTIENGTLTPTQKVKRRVVQERLGAVIDAFYEEENAGRAVLVASELVPSGSA